MVKSLMTRGETIVTQKNKELSSEQREELLQILKDRFEANMNRHTEMEWSKVQKGWKLIQKNCGLLMRWKEQVESRMSLDTI